MQNFSDLVHGKHSQIWGWMEVGRKKLKTGHISETVKDTAKITINH